VTHKTVQRCLHRAVRPGAMAVLDDSPRPGKAPEITDDAKAWLVTLACQKDKDLGYPLEFWTTRLLARHVREHAAEAGHGAAERCRCACLDDRCARTHRVGTDQAARTGDAAAIDLQGGQICGNPGHHVAPSFDPSPSLPRNWAPTTQKPRFIHRSASCRQRIIHRDWSVCFCSADYPHWVRHLDQSFKGGVGCADKRSLRLLGRWC
jgi:hypothetical protein